jgi:hypothetical protein
MKKGHKYKNQSIMDEESYLNSLNERELKTYRIVVGHLGSSFELCKSVGFLKWKRENQSKKKDLDAVPVPVPVPVSVPIPPIS